uniref:Akirin-2 n=1 Tax=Cavia porcellus TaxID=10141 RepID=A0A286XBB1_CAVPO
MLFGGITLHRLILLSNCWKANLLTFNFLSCQIVTFFLLEQILYNIKQEYKRMQKRRHLESSFQQTDPGCSSDAQPHAFLLSGPASPGTSSAASSPLKKEQPLFTLRQVGMICERLLKEREEKVREEYEEILSAKLSEQYDAFVKFTHDQIMRRYGEQPASYVS